MKKNSIVIADDHNLVTDGLESLINNFNDYEVLYTVSNGRELQEKFSDAPDIPDILLLDINMPIIDGYETMRWIKNDNRFVTLKILAITASHDLRSIRKMLELGVNGLIVKDEGSTRLHIALDTIVSDQVYLSSEISTEIIKLFRGPKEDVPILNEREAELFKYIPTELTNKEIADKMYLSEKTINGYTEKLRLRFGVKNRIGLILKGIKYHYFDIYDYLD